MATEQVSVPVNGTYVPHQAQAYSAVEQSFPAVNASSGPSSAPAYGATPAADPSTSGAGNSVSQIPQGEVAWYFVEKYYNTLSKSAEKLFLFYNKHSQFVSGDETERVSVCLGQKAINDRIKELDFQDCKVRVTNVDSQASGEKNIVIQTIGEISNKSKPHRKFVQTFVLAEQTNGYFVLNDIFRYLHDEEIDDEEVQHEPAAVAGAVEASGLLAKAEGDKGAKEVSKEQEAVKLDKKLEEVIDEQRAAQEQSAQSSNTNGTPAEAKSAEPESAPAAPTADVSKEATENVAAEVATQPEKPKEPEPTPAPPQKASPAPRATPAAPPKPAVPKTWASLAASANKSAPPVQAPATTTAAPKPAQPKQPVQAAAPPAQAAPTVTTPPPREASPAGSNPDSAGWQTAGADHGRKQSRSQGQAEAPKVRAYIKNVYPSVDADALRASLEKCGEVVYFDVSRQKNCAFVDFATTSGFQAAVNANPHKIGSEEIYVEERREGPPRYGSFRGGMRGGRGGTSDRQGQGRGGFSKDGNRGNYTPRGGRGGNVPPRPRGGAQAA